MIVVGTNVADGCRCGRRRAAADSGGLKPRRVAVVGRTRPPQQPERKASAHHGAAAMVTARRGVMGPAAQRTTQAGCPASRRRGQSPAPPQLQPAASQRCVRLWQSAAQSKSSDPAYSGANYGRSDVCAETRLLRVASRAVSQPHVGRHFYEPFVSRNRRCTKCPSSPAANRFTSHTALSDGLTRARATLSAHFQTSCPPQIFTPFHPCQPP